MAGRKKVLPVPRKPYKYQHQRFFEFGREVEERNRAIEIIQQSKIPVLNTQLKAKYGIIEIPAHYAHEKGLDVEKYENTDVLCRFFNLKCKRLKIRSPKSRRAFFDDALFTDRNGRPVFGIKTHVPMDEKGYGIQEKKRTFLVFYSHPVSEIIAKAISERKAPRADKKWIEWVLPKRPSIEEIN
ncbi:MAG: hypothetical protein V1776_02095 [Candidatus Diapherotrites archaeon]